MATPVASISALGGGAFAAASRHMAGTFAALFPRPLLVERPGHIRAITGEPHPLGNFAILTDPEDTSSAGEAVRALVDCPMPSAVIALSEVSLPVASLLAEAGFEGHGGMPAMAVDIAVLSPTRVPDGYQFTRVGPDEASEAWTDAMAIGYGLPHSLARVFSPASLRLSDAPDADTQCFAAMCNGRAVATSMLHLADGVAGIYCVATRAEERGKGLGAHLTAEPLRLAAQMGYRVGVLQSSSDGYLVYTRLGFVDLGGMPFYVRVPV